MGGLRATRRGLWSRMLPAVIVATALGGCVGSSTAGSPDTSGPPTATGLSFPLPTSGMNGCAGVLFDGPIILEISEGTTTGRLQNGRIIPMLWPTGFAAWFDPPVWTILDASGAVFAISGQDIGPVMRSGVWAGWETCATLLWLVVY